MISICIPGYNRPDFLQWTLRRLCKDFPQAEIIISDDASTENMGFPQVCAGYGNPVSWIQQESNIGPFPNMLAALSAATGDYAIYCANDDYLLPDEVAKAVAYLDAHPEVAAWCAPCEIWDEVNQKPYWNAFNPGEARTFDKSQGMDLFNFIIGHHVWPEHMIHRVPVALKRRSREYWAFVDIPDILEKGSIHFSPTPFYRNLLVHPVGMRVQLGNVQALTHFDEYRGGLEVMAYGLFGGRLAYSARHQIGQMIQSFIVTRLDCARRLYAQAGHEFEAEMLAKRILIADPRPDVVAA